MELENILKDFLEEKEVKKKETVNEETFLSISSLKEKSKDYEDDYEDEEEDDDYEDEDESEEDEDEEEDDYEELDIELISDVERMKIANDILNHIENDYPGLDKIIMILQDIIEDNNNY